MSLSSAKVLYNSAQKEYEIENDRAKVLETKANMLLVFSSSLLLFFLKTDIQWKAFYYIFSNSSNIKNYEYTISLIVVFLTCVFVYNILFSIQKCISVINLKEYTRLSINSLKDKIFEINDEDGFYLFVAIKYDMATKANRKINKEKAKSFGKACTCILYAIIMFVLYFSILKIGGFN